MSFLKSLNSLKIGEWTNRNSCPVLKESFLRLMLSQWGRTVNKSFANLRSDVIGTALLVKETRVCAVRHVGQVPNRCGNYISLIRSCSLALALFTANNISRY